MLQRSRVKKVWKSDYLWSLSLMVGTLFCIPCTLAAQQTNEGPDFSDKESGIYVPFAEVEQVPVFPGCENVGDPRECFRKMVQKHIAENFRYPEEAREKDVQGRVQVGFTIDEEGNITDIVMRGPHPLLEEEAERIIKLLPKMVPGKQKGSAVKVPFFRPITFEL